MKRLIILMIVSLMLSGCFSDNMYNLDGDEIEIVPTETEHNYLSNLDILKIRNLNLNEDEKFDPRKHKCYGIYTKKIVETNVDKYSISFYCYECKTNEDFNTKNVRMSTYYENNITYSCEYKKWK